MGLESATFQLSSLANELPASSSRPDRSTFSHLNTTTTTTTSRDTSSGRNLTSSTALRDELDRPSSKYSSSYDKYDKYHSTLDHNDHFLSSLQHHNDSTKYLSSYAEDNLRAPDTLRENASRNDDLILSSITRDNHRDRDHFSSDLYKPSSCVSALDRPTNTNTTITTTSGYSDFASSLLAKRSLYSTSGTTTSSANPTSTMKNNNDSFYSSSNARDHPPLLLDSTALDKYRSTATRSELGGATDLDLKPSSGIANQSLYSRERLNYLQDREPLATSVATTSAASARNISSSLYNSLATSGAAAAADKLNTAPTTSGSSNNLIRQLFDDMRQIEDTVDSIEIPARGRCRVFMAKYGYDPFKQSPNENPDAELAFNAGDYIMVFDDVDEDGYFIGELMDGRRGYVPSNWLDRLQGEDLFDFQANVLYKQAGIAQPGGESGANKDLNSVQLGATNAQAQAAIINSAVNLLLDDEALESGSYPPEYYDALISDTINHTNFQHLLAPEDYHRMNDYVDLDDVNEVDDECLSDYERAEAEQMRRAVPPPQRLVLERQLNKCILIAWLHPQSAKGTIVSYQVYVDGVLKSTVPSGDRTKALLEGVDSNIPHRISVRAIDVNGRHSNDAGCTIVIGQKIPFAPSCVKASHITSDSALISWLPCNSNFHHVVAVNSVEVQTVRPGVYKHLINGLSANTLYRVWVRAKPGKILTIDEKNPKKLESLTTYADFKTMPKSLPDPPVNVQVEAGPQRRTLLVTWLPLTLNDFGSSNGCAVTGYAVFAGHKKLADIDSPTGDHALLDIRDLESLHKKSVTVRTKSGENLSQDSMPCHIPDEYLKAGNKEQAMQLAGNQHHHVLAAGTRPQHPQHVQSSSSGVSHSPSRQRILAARGGAIDPHQARHNLIGTGRYPSAGITRAGRPLARSLQNLESDLDSRRSSIPAIEITRETSGSELLNQTESYSEEEFESSMRFRAGAHRGRMRPGARGAAKMGQFRARQSHSVDGSHQQQQQAMLLNRPYQSQANLLNQQRLRGATPAGDIRYFVALFDYDPSTMSPNPNAAAEELAFKEGSIIKVYGQLGEDGFFKGEIDNQIGYVPSNVITEITDPNLLASLYEKNPLMATARQQPPLVGGGGLNQMQAQQTNQLPMSALDQQTVHQQQQQQQQQPSQGGAVKRMVALYDYDPQENSPNADTESEIPFKTGDIIFVYGKMDTDGFYMGEVERTKQRGLVPSNFLREEPLPLAALKQPQLQANTQMQQQRSNVPMMQQQMDLVGQGGQQMQNQQLQMQMQLQQQHQQQQQQLNNANVRGPQQNLMANQQANLQQQQQQQNINRPNSLSLSSMNAPNNAQQINAMNLQGQQMGLQNAVPSAPMMPQQQMAGIPMGMNMNASMNNQMMQQGGQQMMGRGGLNQTGLVGQQQQMRGQMNQPLTNQQQQQYQMGMNPQQQQAGQSGVLSNLLSSGKQIIGAASTPRVPNQPGSFANNMAMSNQMGGNQLGALAGMQQTSAGNMMQQQPQSSGQSALNAFNQTGPMASGISQQQLNNQFGMNAAVAGMMGGQQNPLQAQHQQQQQQQQQQRQPYNNQMGNFNRGGPGGMNQIDGDQGGNILNTVKNMFKL